jgi:poly-gamma-glutamate system protein
MMSGPRTTDKDRKRFSLTARARLLLLAVGMAGLWLLAAPAVPTSQERLLWEKVRAAQLHLSKWRGLNETASAPEDDPWNCGMIGVEWSGITTTLGDLAAKRTACNPAWAVQFSRWFRKLDLEPGDRIAIYASGSFPGMLLNVIAAAEAMELNALLVVSLGASTWGANHPDSPWPMLARELRRGGFIRIRADYYTLGGEAELGRELPPEAKALLRRAATESNVQLLTATNLRGMIERKAELLQAHGPRLLVNIGGSQANLGDDDEVLHLAPGLVPAADIGSAGNGIIGAAMRSGIPAIHVLDIKSLSNQVGIPFDTRPAAMVPVRVSPWWSITGLVLFLTVLSSHRRWRLERMTAR